MGLTRREFLIGAAAFGVAMPTMTRPTTRTSIDRRALVKRHNPRGRLDDPFSALSVGNGEFAFTADVTGLQTFPQAYEKPFPLCTTAQWAWHTTPPSPLPSHPHREDFRYQDWDTCGRPVPYATDKTGQEELFNRLRDNPHRMHLGRVALELTKPDGSPASPADLADVEQTLDLWSGLLSSRFRFTGEAVEVRTCAHPTRDLLAIGVRSPLISRGRLRIGLRFPYPSPTRAMADWDAADRHRSEGVRVDDRRAAIVRTFDGGTLEGNSGGGGYRVLLEWSQRATFDGTGRHHFYVASASDEIELTCLFIRAAPKEGPPSVDQVQAAAAEHWQKFWSEGGAIDLSDSTHPRAAELERRIVLSQYNTAVHCAGSLPPAETGLLFNSWNGKFHLEMHWWHGVHFAAWNRFGLLAKGLDFYQRILPIARDIAARQGYRGARWPKMAGVDGHDSPSPVGPLLIWQQPHPIYYAELCYRNEPTRATLDRWREIVEASADFMASYAVLHDGRYLLGPPMKTVSENTDAKSAMNPAFELAYWRWGLSIARKWRERLGQSREPLWDDVPAKLAPLPAQDGLYLMQEGLTDTFTKWNWEHPALLMPAAMLDRSCYDAETMRRTLAKVMDVWQWDRAWGWDFGMAAMAAARLGEADLAMKALLIDSPKNRHHANGHVYQRENLTAYLPANGALLSAAATIATSSGFPRDGRWSVRSENLSTLL